MPIDRRSFAARFVFTGDGPPIEDGVIELDDDGVVLAVHNRRDPQAVQLGNAAIIPGLINAHTHLEFSDLRQPIEPAAPFTAWIDGVVACRRNRVEPTAAVVRRGLAEAASCGTVAVADIATDDDVAARTAVAGLQVVMFRELLGFRPEQVDPQLQVARRFLERVREFNESPASADNVLPGLSPHAPYSVHPDLLKGAVELAGETGTPVAVHLAETREELEFLDRQTGPLAEMLRRFGVWTDGVVPPGSKPLDVLRVLAEAPRGLVVHGNYLSDQEQRFLAECKHLSLIYCPRTHFWFGHERHPWREVLALGGNVALGTDGRCSNPDLSLWEELAFLHRRFPEVPDEELLRLGTWNAAVALGIDDRFGTLQPGRPAHLAVVDLPATSGDPSLFAGALRAAEQRPV